MKRKYMHIGKQLLYRIIAWLNGFKNKSKIIHSYIYTSILAILLGSTSVSAQTLDDYLKIAAENNPGLKSKFYSYQASLKKVPQVGSLTDPQLSF
ncbi:MAG TPA: hypothetical protein VK870_09120, partial [Ignavibacteriaceae bacterium]|nr:hypothetical protein [Ignavibacteriaceae bacterium]